MALVRILKECHRIGRNKEGIFVFLFIVVFKIYLAKLSGLLLRKGLNEKCDTTNFFSFSHEFENYKRSIISFVVLSVLLEL